MQLGRRAFSIPALVTSFIACVLLLCCTIGTPTTFSTSTPFNVVQATNVIYKSNLSRRDTVDSTSINGFKVRTLSLLTCCATRLTDSSDIHDFTTARKLGLLREEQWRFWLQEVREDEPWLLVPCWSGYQPHQGRQDVHLHRTWLDERVSSL